MTMERASIRVIRKPWGKTDLRPWSELGHDGVAFLRVAWLVLVRARRGVGGAGELAHGEDGDGDP